jgi:hypothetical protein
MRNNLELRGRTLRLELEVGGKSRMRKPVSVAEAGAESYSFLYIKKIHSRQ